MSWLQAIHAKFYSGKRIDAAKSTLRRLTGKPHQNRYLRVEPLDGKRICYYLTKRATRLLGLPEHVATSLGPTALMRHYSRQWFYELDQCQNRWPCSPTEFPDFFPKDGKWPKAEYYLEQNDEQTELGIVVTDFGSHARRVARRTIDRLERILANGWLNDVIASGSFVVTFLSITDSKCKSIGQAFETSCKSRLGSTIGRLGDNACVRTEYRVVPGLLDLVPTEASARR